MSSCARMSSSYADPGRDDSSACVPTSTTRPLAMTTIWSAACGRRAGNTRTPPRELGQPVRPSPQRHHARRLPLSLPSPPNPPHRPRAWPFPRVQDVPPPPRHTSQMPGCWAAFPQGCLHMDANTTRVRAHTDLHGGEPVRDDDDGAARHEPLHCLLHRLLRHRVQRAGRLIQDDDGAVLEQGARDGDALPLPACKTSAGYIRGSSSEQHNSGCGTAPPSVGSSVAALHGGGAAAVRRASPLCARPPT